MKKCPFCAEEIQNEAIKCKYCGEWLNKDETKQKIKKAINKIGKGIKNAFSESENEKIDKKYEQLRTFSESRRKQCPKCKKTYDSSWGVCLTCREPLINLTKEEFGWAKKEFDEIKKAKHEKDLNEAKFWGWVKICKKCGTENIIATKNKESIGQFMPAVTSKFFCDTCGEYLFGNPSRNLWFGTIELLFSIWMFI